MKRKNYIENESIRLAIQAGIVASCLVVISGDYSSLSPSFQLLVKMLAMLLGLLSTAYIMLTARKYGFQNTKDIKIRGWIYDKSITFYWYIFASILYLFASSFITYLTGISFAQIYAIAMIVITIAIMVLLIVKLINNKTKNKKK